MINLFNCDKNVFSEILEKNRVVCFCAGKEFERVCEEYPQIVKKIEYVADNNKGGSIISVNGKDIPVVAFDDDVLRNKKYIGVITTINYADAIIQQLDESDIYDDLRVFFPFFIKTKEEIIFDNKKDIKIPKKIHYCWFGENDIPEQFIKNIESWKKYCPEYEIIKWNETNYNVKKNRYMEQAYNCKKWGFVPDYARLDIINQYGGIYLDTDVELLRPLDDLLIFDLFCGFESNSYVAFGLGFGAKQNSSILNEMMDIYDKTEFVNEDGTMNLTASPVYQTEVLKKHGLKCNGKFQMLGECAIFPKDYFAPIDSFGWGDISDKAYSIHQYSATWFDKDMQEHKKRLMEMVTYVKGRIKNVNSNL